MIQIPLGILITAFTDPPRATRSTPAFIHRTTGEVLLVAEGDAASAKWFPGMPVGKLIASLQLSPEWLRIPKYEGRLSELGAYVREWCEANGFSVRTA